MVKYLLGKYMIKVYWLRTQINQYIYIYIDFSILRVKNTSLIKQLIHNEFLRVFRDRQSFSINIGLYGGWNPLIEVIKTKETI